MNSKPNLKEFFDVQKKAVESVFQHPYFVWIIFIIFLVGLLLLWLVSNNVNIASRYVQLGDACVNARNVIDEVSQKINLNSMDANVKLNVLSELTNVKNKLSSCLDGSPKVPEQAVNLSQPEQKQLQQPEQKQLQQPSEKKEHFRTKKIENEDLYCGYNEY